MKSNLLSAVLFFICLQTIQSQTSYTWTGAVSGSWNVAANWSPGGIPGSADDVKVVAAGNACTLNTATIVNNITLVSGTLDLNGATLTVNGATALFTSGSIQNGSLIVAGANTTTSGTGTVTMNCAVNITSSSISIRNTTFQGSVTIIKTGSSSDGSNGNNIFNAPATITNAGSGNIYFGNGNADQFNSAVTFNNTGSANVYIAYNSSSNLFAGTATFNNTPVANTGIYVSWNSAATVFNNNIIVSSTSGSGVQFCGGNTTASATLSAGHIIGIGAGGFSSGALSLRQFTQSGSMPLNLWADGSAEVRLGPSGSFGGPLTISAPNIYASTSVFDKAVTLTKTDGSTSNASSGGNTFNATLAVNYTSSNGTGYWSFGNGAPDIYNGDVYSNNNSLDRIIFGHNSANNQFNGNFIVTQTGASKGTALTWSSSASAVMAAGKAIVFGGAGFSTGYLYIEGFTQNGSAPINLAATGSSSIYIGAGNAVNPSVIGGNFTISAPDIYVRGGTFNEDVAITKTGGTNNHNDGKQNIFNGALTIHQQSSSGYFMLGYNADDQFNGNVVITSTGTGGISFGWTGGTGRPTLAPGKTITIGAEGYSAGYLQFGGFIQNGSDPLSFNLTGTAYFSVVNPGTPSTFGGPLTVTAPDIYVKGGVFNNETVFTKTGGTSNHNSGNQNIFNGRLTINQQSNSGYFMLGYNADDQFNDDIVVTSTGTGGISLGWTGGTGRPSLAAGKTISIGAAGYAAGYLQLGGFTQNGSAPMNLTLTGSSSFYIVNPGTPCSFGGPVNVSAPDIYVRGGVFNNSATFTKTGGANNYTNGYQNIFNGTLTINQQSSTGYFALGYNSADQFNEDVTVTSVGSGGIYLGYSSGTGSAALAAGKTIHVGAAGFSAGFLSLNAFTQAGNAPVNLVFTGDNTYLRFARNSVIGGNLVASSADIYFDGCIFNGTIDATKTGNKSNASRGGNTFNGHCSITNNGDNYWVLGNNDPDTWNDDVVFTDGGSDRLLPCWASAGNQFNGNIYVNTSGSATGIHFCGGNATATLASGKTIQTGVAGFNAGYLILKQFTQFGNAPVNLTLSSTATYLQFGPSSSFGGNVTSSSPGLFFNGCTFSGAVNSIKTGTTNDGSSGNNIFNNSATLTNAGTGYLMLGNGNADQFNGNATFNNTGSGNIYVAYNSSNNIFGGITTFNNSPVANTLINVSTYSSGTVFNENIVVSSTNGQGVQFCSGNATASAALSAGKTISIGAPGFSAGTLLLKQFTQAGSTAQHLTLTGTGRLVFGPSAAFGGAVTSSSPGLSFNGCTFNTTVNCTKNGTTDDQSSGNNIFNGNAVFTNNGTGYLMMTVSAPDVYNSDVNFVKSSTGLIYPNYNQSGAYGGNLNISSTTAVTLGAGSGTAIFTGSGAQNISVSSGTPVPVFARMEIKNTGAGVTLSNTAINISKTLVLTSGLLHTTTSNMLTMQNTSTVAAGTALSTSYVDGPMRYQKSSSGSTVLNFPVGNGSDCRPVALTVTHSNGTLYTYQVQLFNASAAALGYTLPSAVNAVSSVHYYVIGRTDASGNNQPTAGLSGNQTIQVFFGANDLVTDGGAVTIVKNTYNATGAWTDIGGSGAPPYSGGANLTGSITSTSSPSAFNSFSTFAIAFRISTILPVTLLEFTAKASNNYVDLMWATATESGNNYFTIERSRDGVDFEALQTVNTKNAGGNSSVQTDYAARDAAPYTGRSFYRLKQNDMNGKNTYSKIAEVYIGKNESVSIYPNPTTGRIYINGLDGSSVQTEWYDVSGRLVAAQTIAVQNGLATLDVRLANGVYVLKYVSAKGTWKAQRIIIRR
ncbi:MAG: T9SS type A sorting domain-containing protein [Sphingobacteriales bacterium]|nr:T9SS type A sorting domain-containing protein [Sphingobacteriales bacterium]OJY87402.1 MAG: hypothetical protein BGP14_08645 [Sphingobacteriales bacterium 44-15]